MPDMERAIDNLHYSAAKTLEEKAYVEGYIKGKTKARKEVLYLFLLILILIIGYSLC